MNGLFLGAGDLIGNPLIYPVQSEDDNIDVGYSTSQGGTWSIGHQGIIYNDLSIMLLSGIEKGSFLNVFSPITKRVKKRILGYAVPISIQEILDQEYALIKDIEDMGFSDEVLEEVQFSSFGASRILEMTNKKEKGKWLIAYHQIGGSRKEENDVREEIPEGLLSA